MTEVVQKKGFRFQLEMTTARLLKFRKMFLLGTSLLLVAAAVNFYIEKAVSLEVALDLVLATLFFSFSNKCESLLLKQKIDDILCEKVIADKEV
jgi:hypothetical protein